jgi:4-amino-4-deoxy-L-arabinose transferase-like glycosyltransferase
MDGLLRHRSVHYLLLLAVGALLTLVNLGQPSLWDMDEGLNAEAAREMYESGNWVVPKFNFQLRDAKPALLYWLEATSYLVFGVNEFAARLPSALATIIASLLIYELGRAMFSNATGLLAGIVLPSCLLVCGSAHFANPDAILLACTTLSFLCFWLGFASRHAGEPPRRSWFLPYGAACAIGMLAKGPIAIILPGSIITVFLAWQGQLRCLWDRRVWLAAAAFTIIALPWYVMVGIETRCAFTRGFFIQNNVERFLAPMDTHRGPVWYHLLVMLVGFAPWSIFLIPTFWQAISQCRRRPTEQIQPDQSRYRAAHRLVLCWFLGYLVFFSIAKTKLPSYTLPLYPALALMSARFLDAWRLGESPVRRWLMACGLGWLFVIGLGTSVTALAVGGMWHFPQLPIKSIPAMTAWAFLGVIPVIGSGVGLALLATGRRRAMVAVVGVTAVGFVAPMLGGAAEVLNKLKASRELIAMSGACQRDRDVRLAGYQYMQPSLVFYGQRIVRWLNSEDEVARFLSYPAPSYVFLTEADWLRLQSHHPDLTARAAASHWDMYRNCEIVVITNQTSNELAQRP